MRIIRWKFLLSTLFENLFSEAFLLNSRLYWPIKQVETDLRGWRFCFSPEADAHFREMSAHVNTYFKKSVIFALNAQNTNYFQYFSLFLNLNLRQRLSGLAFILPL